MASLKRDTPAGRAALARRRQRAAAVVDHSARFFHSEEEGVMGASEDSNQSPQSPHPQVGERQQPASSSQQQQQQQQYQQQQPQQPTQKYPQQPQKSHQGAPPMPATLGRRDPPPQQQKPQPDIPKQQRTRLKDPPPRTAPSGTGVSSATSYSTASLPSSDELYERNSQAAQHAASVLASARKSKNPPRVQITSSNKPTDKERSAGGLPARKAMQEPVMSQPAYETPSRAFHSTSRAAATEGGPANTSKAPPLRMAGQPYASAETTKQQQEEQLHNQQQQQQHKEEQQQQQQQQQKQQTRLQQLAHAHHQPPPATSIQHATTPKMKSSHEVREGREDPPSNYAASNAVEFLDNPNTMPPPSKMSGEGITMEEREPVVSFQHASENLDAACLRSGSWVMLRSMTVSATVAITLPSSQDDSNDVVAVVSGSGLGTAEEVFQVVKSDGTLRELENLQDDGDVTPLRWGDNVALISNHENAIDYGLPRVLGVRKRVNKQGGSTPIKGRVGWFHPTSDQVETWTLLRGHDGSKYGVRVGLSASQAAKMLAERRDARGECTRVVASGDPVLLRHNQTGGILSVKMGDGSLEIVSDSYDSDRGDAFRPGSTGATSGLISQLQRHNLYLPTDQDTFTLLEREHPPCPRWILGGGGNQNFNPLGHRMYLHQTYLQHRQRHSLNPYLQDKIFRGTWSSLITALDEEHEIVESVELDEQENIMSDEVLGACLGLEGKYIRAYLSDQDDYAQANFIAAPQNIGFRLRGGLESLFDASLRNLAERILPLGNSYTHVSAFVASHLPGYVYGSVMQAFCEALDDMLREYGIYIAKLEEQFRQPQSTQNNPLTLRKLHAHLTPSLHTMSILEKATVAVRGKTGGSLLNALSTLKSWSCEGDLVALRVLGILLDKSSIPYMTMLTTWLQHGLLQDPYSEFMIEVNGDTDEGNRSLLRHSANSDFNNESYFLREEHVLTELMSSELLLQKVVAAGRYWRAVRACEVAIRKKEPTGENENENVMSQSTAVLQYSLSFSAIASFIQSMYEGASQALVNLLMRDFNLMDSLRTMKQYFLLDHGEFFLNLMDTDAENELLKELGDVSTGRIQHWLRMSVQLTEQHGGRGSGHQGDSMTTGKASTNHRTLSPLALRCRFQPISLINHIDSIKEGLAANNGFGKATRDDSLVGTPSRDAYGMSNKGLTGVETFVLDFPSVPYPISLVLAENAISSYQLLFRLLFFAKYVERRLLGIWQDHQAMKELNSVRGLFGPTFILRQRMLHFAQNLIYYFMFEVIEPNWLEMEKAIGDPATANRRTVDDIVEVHEAFLHGTLEACLLTNRELVRTLTKLMTTCLMFADQMKLFTEATRIHDESSHVALERRRAIQRSLNDRGGGGSKAPVDKTALRDAIHSFKHDRQARLKKQKRRVGRELSSESYRRMVGRFEEVFSAYLSEFMLQLNSDVGTASQEHKTNLCIRLDYNGFLSSGFDKSRLNLSN